jgi:hypothetical protein
VIDLTTLARVRFQRGTRTHAVTPPGEGKTACGKYVHLFDPWGRRQDTALSPETPVTCAGCNRKGATS